MIMDILKKAMIAQFFYQTNMGKLDVSFKGQDGTTRKMYKPDEIISASNTLGNLMKSVASTNQNNATGVLFGDGDIEPTKDDYKLSGTQLTGLNISASVKGESEDDGGSVTAVYTIANGKSSDVTIREVGLLARINYASSYSTSTLVERTVLDTPVTIPAGGVGQVTYTIRFNYPTA